ncbi:hypothetical protein D3C80_1384290 [compost metagenome]
MSFSLYFIPVGLPVTYLEKPSVSPKVQPVEPAGGAVIVTIFNTVPTGVLLGTSTTPKSKFMLPGLYDVQLALLQNGSASKTTINMAPKIKRFKQNG